MTYASRYFLYKSLSVPTDKDDPDAFENSIKGMQGDSPDPEFLTIEEQKHITSLAPEARLKRIMGMYNVETLAKVERRHFGYIVQGLKKEGVA